MKPEIQVNYIKKKIEHGKLLLCFVEVKVKRKTQQANS